MRLACFIIEDRVEWLWVAQRAAVLDRAPRVHRTSSRSWFGDRRTGPWPFAHAVRPTGHAPVLAEDDRRAVAE